MSGQQYNDIRQFLRAPNYPEHFDISPPRDPSTTWYSITSYLVGVQPNAIPAEVNIKSPRVGRVFRMAGHDIDEPELVLAIYPADESIQYIPPYPGLQPDGFKVAEGEMLCFTDGSLAKWDFRRYPQLYDPRKPWLGFAPYCHSTNSPDTAIEAKTPLDFFHWYQPGNPERGGTSYNLNKLFRRKEELETRLLGLLKMALPFIEWPLYDIPFYNGTDYKTARGYKTWRELRDRLSPTLIYMGEIAALCSWIEAEIRRVKGDQQSSGLPASYMGVWAPTIPSQEEWRRLRDARIPIYMIMEVSPASGHYKAAQNGNIDGDERFRHDGFNAAHLRMNSRHFSGGGYQYSATPDLPLLSCSQDHLPISLRDPSPLPRANNSSTVSYQSWRTYPWLDEAIFRCRIPPDPTDSAQRHKEMALFPFLPPGKRLLCPEQDPHPLLQVLREERDNKTTYIYEESDDQTNSFWPRYLSNRARVQLRPLYIFEFTAERLVIMSDYPFPGRTEGFGRVLDNYDDPDDDWGLPVMKQANRPKASVGSQKRKYYKKKPNTMSSRPDFEWMPPPKPSESKGPGPLRTAKSSSKAGSHTIAPYNVSQRETFSIDVSGPNPPSLGSFMAGHHLGKESATAIPETYLFDSYLPPRQVFPRNSVSCRPDSYLQLQLPSLPAHQRLCASEEEVMEHPLSPIVVEESISPASDPTVPTPIEVERDKATEQLQSQREELHLQIGRRLFNQRYSHLRAEHLAIWRLPNSNISCYPVRIANLHGASSHDTILKWLATSYNVEVLLFHSYEEVDTTRTVDLGLRYCEDAMLLCIKLHCAKVDDRLLEVYPLNGLGLKGRLVHEVLPSARSPQQRLAVIDAIRAQQIDHQLATRPQARDVDDLHHVLGRLCLSTPAVAMDTEISDMITRPCSAFSGSLITDVCKGSTKYRSFAIKTQDVVVAPQTVEDWTLRRELAQYQDGNPILFEPAPKDTEPSPTPVSLEEREEGETYQEGILPISSTSSKSKKRPKRKAPIRGHEAHRNPQDAPSMTRDERRNLKQSYEEYSRRNVECWKELKLDGFQGPKDVSLKDWFIEFWNWQDKCREEMQRLRDQHPERYDYSTFEDVFTPIAKLRGVYGKDLIEVQQALEQRRTQHEIQLPRF